MNRKTQRLYAGLCLAICGGFLIGTLRERFTAKPMSLPATPAPTPAEADALQQALGSYRAALTETTSDTERIAVAQKLSDLGLAAHHRDKGRGSIAIAAFEEAEAAFRSAKAWKRLALTNAIHAEALLLRGRTEEAIALWRETSAIVPRVSEADFAPTIQLQAGEFFLDRGRLFDARAVLTAAQSAFAAQNDRKGVAHCRRYLGGAALEEGDVQTARRELSASLQALTALKDEPTIAAVQGTLGDVALREGDWSEAERRYASGSELLAKNRAGFLECSIPRTSERPFPCSESHGRSGDAGDGKCAASGGFRRVPSPALIL